MKLSRRPALVALATTLAALAILVILAGAWRATAPPPASSPCTPTASTRGGPER